MVLHFISIAPGCNSVSAMHIIFGIYYAYSLWLVQIVFILLKAKKNQPTNQTTKNKQKNEAATMLCQLLKDIDILSEMKECCKTWLWVWHLVPACHLCWKSHGETAAHVGQSPSEQFSAGIALFGQIGFGLWSSQEHCNRGWNQTLHWTELEQS